MAYYFYTKRRIEEIRSKLISCKNLLILIYDLEFDKYVLEFVNKELDSIHYYYTYEYKSIKLLKLYNNYHLIRGREYNNLHKKITSVVNYMMNERDTLIKEHIKYGNKSLEYKYKEYSNKLNDKGQLCEKIYNILIKLDYNFRIVRVTSKPGVFVKKKF